MYSPLVKWTIAKEQGHMTHDMVTRATEYVFKKVGIHGYFYFNLEFLKAEPEI